MFDGCEVVSPSSQTFSSSGLSFCNQVIFEVEEPIDVFSAKKAIMNILLPRYPRFCCKMTQDRHGVLYWVKTEVNVDDHVFVPEFPGDQSEYDEFVNDYIDNPNLPITFPSFRVPSHKTIPYYSWVSAKFMHYMFQRLFVLVLVMCYTVTDLISTILRSILIEDSKLPIRGPHVEMLPKVMSFVTFSMEDVKKIKNSIGGTVNDVILGIIFYGFQQYLHTTLSNGEKTATRKKMTKSRVTATVAINTRAISKLNDIKDMLKANSQATSGNHFGLLHIPMPLANAESPLDFVQRAKEIMDRKKMSLGVFLTERLLGYLGPRASATVLYNTLANTTMALSNIIGPTEKIEINHIPVKSISFSTSGIPQTLFFTVVSYMGSVRLGVIGTKGYVNSDTLAKCLTECFEEMKEAAKGF